jgi:glycosyltransferase involved in cell wall biosynthesis
MSREVFVLTTAAPDRPGGQERFVQGLLRVLEKRGYRVRVFHAGNCAPKWLQRPTSWVFRHLSGVLVGYFVGRVARREQSADVIAVISNATVGWYPLRGNAGARKIHFYHGTYRGQAEAVRPFISALGYQKLKWWDAMVLERLSGRGKLCLANSEQTAQEVKRFFGHDCVTTWLPIETCHFCPGDRVAARRALGVSESARVGLFVGSANPTKGFPMVQALMNRFPTVDWLLALRGELPPDVTSRPGVRVFQNADYAKLPLLYNAADVFICPSRYESFGYVVAEALACGTPTVASPGGASRKFLGRPPFDRFLIADPDDVEAFAGAIAEILQRPVELRQQVIEQVRPQIIELMAPENWARRFFEVTGL